MRRKNKQEYAEGYTRNTDFQVPSNYIEANHPKDAEQIR